MNVHMKNFIFGNEPANWMFRLSEENGKHKQVVDLTDDATGELHSEAKLNVCLYVNEVRHSEGLKTNVLSQEINGRSIHYHLCIGKPMKKGETIELLVDCLDGFERSRERKYDGKTNTEDGFQSDNYNAIRMLRLFKERKDIDEKITTMSEEDMQACLHFIENRILKSVLSSTTSLCKDTRINGFKSESIPSSRQWLARRRIHWVEERLKHRMDQFQSKKRTTRIATSWDFSNMDRVLRDMKWDSTSEILSFSLDHCIKKKKDLEFVLREEISGEILFAASKHLHNPYNEYYWCPIATKLLNEAIRCIASSIIFKANDVHSHADLVESLIHLVCTAARSVVDSCTALNLPGSNSYDAAIESLSFQSAKCNSFSSRKPFVKYKPDFLNLLRGSSTDKKDHFNSSKSGMSAIAEDLAYCDAIELCGINGNFDFDSTVGRKELCFIMAECPWIDEDENMETSGQGNRREYSMPRYLDAVVKCVAKVNIKWYLVHQIIGAINALVLSVKNFGLTELIPSENDFFKQLCSAIGIDEVDARQMLSSVVFMPVDNEVEIVRRDSPRKQKQIITNVFKKSKKSGYSFSPVFKPAFEKDLFWLVVWPCLKSLGWKIDFGNRPQDRYFLPPGVTRQKGFSSRIDFFDSVAGVLRFIQQDNRWNSVSEVVESLEQYRACLSLSMEIRSSKNVPQGFSPEWLIAEVKARK
mmetsp:Transcript_46730/g.69110  ORF Transcript_46730/g.69110 Transcript_46730/m.69110 type:complete len:698 (+) Transcript_46730:212-2305(+)